MIVMEDVDLVAMERVHVLANPILVELLNAMDGLDEDADLIFALTTNRPDLLEPALASRPGHRPRGGAAAARRARGRCSSSTGRACSSTSPTGRPSSRRPTARA